MFLYPLTPFPIGLILDAVYPPLARAHVRVVVALILWRSPPVPNCLGLDFLPQAGPFGPVKGAGDGARVIMRDGGAPVQEIKEQQAQRKEGGSNRLVTPHQHFLLSLHIKFKVQGFP